MVSITAGYFNYGAVNWMHKLFYLCFIAFECEKQLNSQCPLKILVQGKTFGPASLEGEGPNNLWITHTVNTDFKHFTLTP